MKTKIISLLLIVLMLTSSMVFADDLNKYTLEFNHIVVNNNDVIKDIEVELMSFSKEGTPYYRVLSETSVLGTNLYKEYSAFTYTFKGLEPGKMTTLRKYYDVNLYPMNYNIIPSKVTTNLGGNENYLNPEQFIVSDDPLIIQTAKSVVGAEKNQYEKAKLLYAYVASEMKYDIKSPISSSGSYSAIRDILRKKSLTEETKKGLVYDGAKDDYNPQTFNTQQGGLCFDYATLLTALLRSQGIPSRVVVGYVVTDDDVKELKEKGETNITENPHAWVEIYLAPYGWVHADPTISGLSFEQAKKTFVTGNQLYLKQGFNFPFIKYKATSGAAYSSIVKLKNFMPYKSDSGLIAGDGSGEGFVENTTSPEKPQTPIVSIDKKELTRNVLDKKKSLSLYYDTIQSKVDKNGVMDYVDSKITENGFMTRAKAFSLIYLIMDTPGKYEVKEWEDLKGHWSQNYTESLSKSGIANGYPDKTLKPDRIISEEESSMLIENRFNTKTDTFSNRIKDFIMGIKTYLSFENGN